MGFSTFSAYSLSYLSGCPDFTVPVGEVPFVSDFTGVEEMLPVAVSVVGRVGDEGRILALLRAMVERGELKDVKAGRQMYAS